MYAVVFVSQKSPHTEGYASMLEEMLELGRQRPGFIRVDSVDNGGQGITVSWWQTLEDIDNWRRHPRHLEAKKRGRDQWYESYRISICKVDQEWEFKAAAPKTAVPTAALA